MTKDTPRIGFVSLGCPKNLVDSERILSQLRYEGYGISSDYEGSDLVVINTCGFIESAVEESMETIGEALENNGKVIVTGCLGARAEQIRQRYPGVLAVSGAHAYEEVMGAVHQHAPIDASLGSEVGVRAPKSAFAPGAGTGLADIGVKLTPRHYAYLKIAEGCSHRCSFCIIPQLRGDLVSRPLDQVLLEAENLATSGVRELLVISQDTAAYGQEIRHRTAFWQGRPVKSDLLALSRELAKLGIWIRLHYLYPYQNLDALLPMMAEGAILPYLDMPLQHSSAAILRAMRRPAASERMLERIERWRTICPDLTLRSTFIVGFPGETDADFEGLLDFVEAARIDRGGCFSYSDIEGAASRELPGQLPQEVKEERRRRLMERLARISRERLARHVGKVETVLVDEVHNDHVIARGAGDAPEIDGVVVIDGAWELDPGDFVEVEITASDEHDLHGRMHDYEEAE